jgi:hypothetical protein
VQQHATTGVAKSKPRFKPAKEELPELSRTYLEVRNRQMLNKAKVAEMELAERRCELIEKRLVEQQAAYLLVALRQKILNVPQTWCRKLVGVDDAAQVSRLLKEMSISILNEVKDLPGQVTDPNWLDELDAPEEKDNVPDKPSRGRHKAPRRKA